MQMNDLLEEMVALANGVHCELAALPDDRARYDLVKQIVDEAEVVFAVWTDESAQDGVGYLLVKGRAFARQFVADDTAVSVCTAAIPCSCVKQAEALLHELGERDSPH
jgi:hypothetical protein